MEEQLKHSFWFWALIAAILLTQSTWLFLDARKRDSMPWFWGIWGLIQFPLPTILYWLIVRKDLLGRIKERRRK
ncbi:sigmaY antisigma factor component [Paenibacillus nanensis]|uniref:SigmaY antisigma factor component n=1 Tax=Paenibacillus nanensis TaxID=393251 RepID=A0A3A1USH4_9BACL|nr:sigmaY antisigma factor component [Paenibacillus nanensis]RIX50756.1 sigmaY antisigma factor component [Paenibacillus nanensis]